MKDWVKVAIIGAATGLVITTVKEICAFIRHKNNPSETTELPLPEWNDKMPNTFTVKID